MTRRDAELPIAARLAAGCGAALIGLAVALLAAARPAVAAPGIVIYRCVAADGAVTIQNGVKCPKGTREQKRVLDLPAAPSAPRLAPAPAAPAPVAAVPAAPLPPEPAPAAPDTPRLPPPPIFACLTADAQRYYSDATEASRCAPAATVGLDGRPLEGVEACEVVQDRCAPVPEPERCAAWGERRRAAEHALTFVPGQAEAARAELERIDAATAGTACGR